MAIQQGEDIRFIGTQSYSIATGSNKVEGALYFTTDTNGSIVVNGKTYGTTNSDLLSAPTKGALKEYIDDVATGASEGSAGALSSAKQYTNEKIAALDVTDTAVAGQYVSAVSETDGKISVTRAKLPDLTNFATIDYVNNNIAYVIDNAPENFNTLKEIADWINGDGVNATELSTAVAKAVKSVSVSNTWTDSTIDNTLTTTLSYTLGTGTTTNVDLSIPYALSNKAGVVTPGKYLTMSTASSAINFDTTKFFEDTQNYASKDKYGFIKVGDGVKVSNGVISVDIEAVEGTISYAEYSDFAHDIVGGDANYLVYQTAEDQTGFIAPGTNGQVLKMVNGKPAWGSDTNNYNKVDVTASTSGVTYLVSSTSGNGDKSLNYSSKVYVNNGTGALYATNVYASSYLYENNKKLSDIYLNKADYNNSSNTVNNKITNITNDIVELTSYLSEIGSEVSDIKTYLQWE